MMEEEEEQEDWAGKRRASLLNRRQTCVNNLKWHELGHMDLCLSSTIDLQIIGQ